MNSLNIHIVEYATHQTILTMPIAGNTQPDGLLHGGASAALAETAASMAALKYARDTLDPDAHTVAVELSISHLKAGRGSHVTATAKPVHTGATSAVYLVNILDENDRLIASARVSHRIITSGGSCSTHISDNK